MKIKLPNKTKKRTGFDPLLYGKDDEENIVAVEHQDGDPIVEVFTRDDSGKITSRWERCNYFFYTNHAEPLLEDMYDDQAEIYELEGDLHYDTIVFTEHIKTYYWFRKNCKENNFYGVRPRGQYLLCTGKTLFKGMNFDDPLRLYFDIETYTGADRSFPNPVYPEDKITIISVKINHARKNNKMLFVLDDDEYFADMNSSDKDDINDWASDKDIKLLLYGDESEMLEDFFSTIQLIDPDVIAGHNVFNFDLWFIHRRCKLHDIPMRIGRDDTEPDIFDAQVAISDKKRDILCFQPYGRHIVDTEILARQDDAVKRSYANYKLKYLVKEIGEEEPDRIVVPGGRIADAWDETDPDYNRLDLIKYAMDDAKDAQKLDRVFGGAVFESTKFTPYPYQDVFRLATGGKSETLFVRYYFDHEHSLPKADKIRNYGGGYADVFKYGYIDEPITYGDISSLYPSLAVNEDIQPKDDVLGYFQKVVNRFIDFRYDIKYKISDAETEHQQRQLKSTDGAIKMYLNTISYGYLGSMFALFNDYDEAERITTRGRETLKKMIDHIEDHGGQAIKCDTDGVLFIPPDDIKDDKEAQHDFMDIISDEMPKGIDVDVEGLFQCMLTVDGKSYALKNYEGRVDIKGDTLKSRSMVHFNQEHLEDCVFGILDEDMEMMEESFNWWKQKIQARDMEPSEIIQYQELKEPLETYKNKVEVGPGNGGRNPSAPYEIALAQKESGEDVQVGDRIEYYVSKPIMTLRIHGNTGKPYAKPKSKRVSDNAKDMREYKKSDLNVDYYLERLQRRSRPLFMLFWDQEKLEEKFGIKLRKKYRERMEEIEPKLFHPLNSLVD